MGHSSGDVPFQFHPRQFGIVQVKSRMMLTGGGSITLSWICSELLPMVSCRMVQSEKASRIIWWTISCTVLSRLYAIVKLQRHLFLSIDIVWKLLYGCAEQIYALFIQISDTHHGFCKFVETFRCVHYTFIDSSNGWAKSFKVSCSGQSKEITYSLPYETEVKSSLCSGVRGVVCMVFQGWRANTIS